MDFCEVTSYNSPDPQRSHHGSRSGARADTLAPPAALSEAVLPTRILRDGILESARFDKIAPQSQVFYYRLISVVDDYGRYTADVPVLLSRCFPRRPIWATEELISLALAECASVGLLVLYSFEDQNYLEIQRFDQRIRARESRYPPPSAGICQQRAVICQQSAASRARTISSTITSSILDSKKEEESFSLQEPWDWFRELYPAAIPNTMEAVQFFCSKINTPDKLSALHANMPLWADTRKFKEGFAGSWQKFIGSEVWMSAPKPAEMNGYSVPKKSKLDQIMDQI